MKGKIVLGKRLSQILFIALTTVGLGQTGFTTDAPSFQDEGHFRYVIQTEVTDPHQLTLLSRWLGANHFDVAGMNWSQGQVEVVTTQAGVNFLTQKGLKGSRILVEDLAVDPRYLNPQTLEAKMRAVNQAYPALTHIEQIGTSLQGRPIYAMLLSTTPNPSDPRYYEKPTLLFDGQHHAREIMTSEVVMDVADALLSATETSAKAAAILNRWNIWLVPMVNVDGTNIVFTRDNMWRKNARGDQRSVFGVDVNRNYPYRWSGCRGSSGSTGAQDYHGASAASEPETVAMVNLGRKIRPTASLSYHSYSEFVLYPYGCNGDFTPERVLVAKIAGELAARLPRDSGGGNYRQGTPWELLYDVDGSSMDFFYASFGTLSYTFEINQSFQPSYSMREPTLKKHRGAWGYFLNRIDQNLLHVAVVDGRAGRAAEALIGVEGLQGSKGELPLKTNEAGHFFKVLDPGHYVLAARLADGRTGRVEVQMNGAPQAVTITIP